jgi:hypothetical protein
MAYNLHHLLGFLAIGILMGIFCTYAFSPFISTLPATGTPADLSASAGSVGDTNKTSYIFVQEASGGSFVRDTTGNFTLTMTNVIPHTLYFSDRPAQNAGFIPTDKFIGGFDWNPQNPPNALIRVRDAQENEDMVVVKLTSPRYNETGHSVTYTAQILPNGTFIAHWTGDLSRMADARIPETFGQVTLVIDDCGCRQDSKCPSGCRNACWNWKHIICEKCGGCCTSDACNRCQGVTVCV